MRDTATSTLHSLLSDPGVITQPLSPVADFMLSKEAAESPEQKYPVPTSLHTWFKPYDHQGAAVQKMLENDGRIILAHKMGLGKTATAVYGFELLKEQGKAKKALVVVPAGLRENFAKEGVGKFVKDPSWQIVASSSEGKRENYVRPANLDPAKGKDYTVVSYSMFRRDPEGLMRATGADTLILDEFHKARNEGSGVFAAAIKARQMSKNFIGLTASLVNNDPAEVASLLTISEGKRMITPAEFRRKHVKTVGVERGFRGSTKKVKALQDKPRLVKNLEPRVDYAESSMLKGGKTLPKKDTRYVDVPMSKEQYKLYQLAMKDLGPLQTYITRRDKNVTVKDAETLFARTSQARQIANSVHAGKRMSIENSARATPKVRKLLDDAQAHLAEKPDNKIVLYSNLINGGVDVLSAGLKARGVPHEIFVGKGTEVGGNKITSEVRDTGVANFKKGTKRVLVLSGAGAEGLSLNNATAFYALDGHFNPERIQQAEARVRRLGGQSHRAPEERVVDVRRYRSVAPASGASRLLPRFMQSKKSRQQTQTTDQWMYSTAERKFKQNKELYDTLKEPNKYVRRWKDPKTNQWRYEYPKEQRTGVVSRLTSFFKKPREASPVQGS